MLKSFGPTPMFSLANLLCAMSALGAVSTMAPVAAVSAWAAETAGGAFFSSEGQ